MKTEVTNHRRRRTRKDLLEAAARLMEQGKKPTLEEIAEEALVSRATAYRYFPSVEALLNEAQYRAVTAGNGPVLVVAGAGTGKTRTLVFRVARLVELGVDPRSLLLLTFPRKASAEMLRRAAGLLDGRCEQVAGGTFHSFANIVLRRYGPTLGLESSFTSLPAATPGQSSVPAAQLGLERRTSAAPRKEPSPSFAWRSTSRARHGSLTLGPCTHTVTTHNPRWEPARPPVAKGPLQGGTPARRLRRTCGHCTISSSTTAPAQDLERSAKCWSTNQDTNALQAATVGDSPPSTTT